MARGNQRSSIFLDDEDRNHFLDTFDEVCRSHGWEVYAWTLMTNHYHIALRTPEPNLADGMKWFQNAYTRRFNARHRGWGRLFGDRYKSELVQTRESMRGALDYCPSVDGQLKPRNEKLRYLRELIDYIHLNPARARMVETAEEIAAYRWSSLGKGYLARPAKRPSWLATDRGFGHIGHPDSPNGRADYLERLARTVLEENADGACNTGLADQEEHEAELSLAEEKGRPWYWGDEAFGELIRDGFLEADEKLKRSGAYQSSDMAREIGQLRAEALLEKARQHFSIKDLRSVPRGDRRRNAIAWGVWTRSSGIRQSWLAQELGVKSAASLSGMILKFRKMPERELSNEIKSWKIDLQ